MATISREKNGTVRIWFVDVAGKRKGVRIGKVSDADAERFKLRVEDLANAATLNRSPRPDVVQWVEGLSDEIQDRLARVGLVEIEQAEPESDKATLATFIDEWVASRLDVKPAMKQIYSRSRHYLIEFNPFSDMRCNVTHDETGDFTVTPEIIQGCLAWLQMPNGG